MHSFRPPFVASLALAIVLIACLAGAVPVHAGGAPPTGVYCSCPPTTSTGASSYMATVAAKPYVSGFLVRIGWSDLEPQPGQYAWALVDSQLARCRASGKRATLGIVCGPMAPAWLWGMGAQRFPYLLRGAPDTLAVPWDPVFLSRWTQLVAAVGARYDSDPTLALVHVTHSTYNGFEMQQPFSPPDISAWQARGYTHARLATAYQPVIDAFAAAFPSTPLDVETHPVMQSDSVSTLVTQYAQGMYGSRIGVFAAWWSQKNTTVYPGQYAQLQAAALDRFATVQMVTNATSDSVGFGTGGLEIALSRSATDGVRYWEVWNSDLLNTTFTSLLTSYSSLATADVGEGARSSAEAPRVSCSPNPVQARTAFRFRLDEPGEVTVRVHDVSGRVVRTLEPGRLVAGEHLVWFDVSGLAPGVYAYAMRIAGREYSGRIVRVR